MRRRHWTDEDGNPLPSDIPQSIRGYRPATLVTTTEQKKQQREIIVDQANYKIVKERIATMKPIRFDGS